MRVFWISAVVVLIDQATKAAVLNLMYRQQSIAVLGDWLKLTFTENPGMAFGLTIGPPGTVTVLAMIATGLVATYVYQVRNTYAPYQMSLAFILGGAIGNIIDRVFYGWWLGYGELFLGRVVDFIHVSLWQGFIPEAIPFVGGAYMELFPIWNVADMAIVLGVVGVLFFHHGFHERLVAQQAAARDDAAPDAAGTTADEAARDGVEASAPQRRGGTSPVDPSGNASEATASDEADNGQDDRLHDVSADAEISSVDAASDSDAPPRDDRSSPGTE